MASYEAGFATTWGHKVRTEIETNSICKIKIRQDKRSSSDFQMKGYEGTMLTTGVGGPITGRGADLFIIDDPVKNWEEAMSEVRRENAKRWYESVAETRLEPKGSVIVIMTRWHEDDLAGFLINSHNFDEIRLPALAEEDDPIGRQVNEALCPERFDTPTLMERRKRSSRAFEALYQQRPSSATGDILKRHYWKFYDELPIKKLQGEWIQSWDLSFKDLKTSDYVVGAIFCRSEADVYLVDIIRGQWGLTETCAQIIEASRIYPQAHAKLIEDKANGPAVCDVLKSKVPGIRMIEPYGTKIARAMAAEPYCASGNVYLPRKAHWKDQFIEECAAFPKGKNDDQVDAFTQAIAYFQTRSFATISSLAKL